MNESPRGDVPEGATGERPGFFGAERARPTEEIPPEICTRIDDYLARNPGKEERLIPLLHMVQEALGYHPFAVQEYIAERLGLSPIQVYGVLSFYHFFTTTPRGKHRLKVCMGTTCFIRHARCLVETMRRSLGIEVGGVTEDRLFSLEQTRCLGACSLAPAIQLDNDTLGNLTPESLRETVLGLEPKAGRRDEDESSESSSD
ncbi:MAG: NADH-quinone oxidoreductase subunit NuoE family protein [Planctomycetota bacterium]|jgi:NADH:ubiquinone oxidoreductase subunit E